MPHVTPETIETERLVLRPYREADRAYFVALATDPEVMRFVGDGPMTPERVEAVFDKVFALYEEGAWGIWAIEERASGRLVGSAEIKPRKTGDWEIVYLFDPTAWGKGYATEVARRLVDYGFERLELPRVVATVEYDNEPSLRVLRKAGMRQIAEESDEIGAYAVYGVERPDAAR